MEPAPSVGSVFSPLDEELALLPGRLAPRQQEHLTHLASFMPFEQASQMGETLLGVRTTRETIRQLAERMGTGMQAAQTAESEAPSAPASREEPKPVRCALSADGAMISLVKKQWVEVRTLAIGVPKTGRGQIGEQEIHVGQLSYFSRLADASTFTILSAGEMRRRRVAQAEAVCAVTDGADWCQTFTETHRPDAVRILDFPHAAEHVSKLLEALEQTGMHFPDRMLERCLHVLKHRGPRPLLRMADQISSDLSREKGIQEHLDYLRKREPLMQYHVFRAQGWPIGSGMVESANKNVVQARLKGPGMHWERGNVNAVLALRLAVCNERWQEMWLKALQQTRAQKAQGRAVPSLLQASSPPISTPSSPSEPPDTSSARSPARAPEAARPRPSQPSHSRKARLARNRMRDPHHGLGEVRTNVCPCGAPLLRIKGHRRRQYCSDRCRQRAFRKRSVSIATRDSLCQRLKDQARQLLIRRSSRPFIKVSADACPCGTPLTRVKGHRRREYCSDRCRQRAFRWRQTQVQVTQEQEGHFQLPDGQTGRCHPS